MTGIVVLLMLGGKGSVVGAVALTAWALGSYCRGTAGLTAWSWQGRLFARSAMGVGALLAFAVAVGAASAADLRASLIAIAAASCVPLLARQGRPKAVRTVLVGDRMSVATLANSWMRESRVQLVTVCVTEPDLDADQVPQEILGVPAVASVEQLVLLVDQQKIDAVVVAPPPSMAPDDFRRLSWLLENTGASLSVVSVADSALPGRISTTTVGGKTVHEVAPSRPSTYTRALKTAIDRSVGLALLVLASPLLALLVIAIRLDSQGPGLFRQERVGRVGVPFTMYKLRTMRRDAESSKGTLVASNEVDGVLFKMRQDPRITRLGGLLRKLSLDELPQLINVVRGEMSLVGPRPALADEVAKYPPDMRRRLAVKPGLTGLWQVSGRSDLPWEQATRLDLLYTDNVGIGHDFRIALRTVDAVVRSKGAY